MALYVADIIAVLSGYISRTTQYRLIICGIADNCVYYRSLMKYYTISYNNIYELYRYDMMIYYKTQRESHWIIGDRDVIYYNNGSYTPIYTYMNNNFSLNIMPEGYTQFYIMDDDSEIIEVEFSENMFCIRLDNIHRYKKYRYYKKSRQLIYSICDNHLKIYYKSGAIFCDIVYIDGILDKTHPAIFYYPSGVIIREYK